jgi:malate dehydrogenase (oxaloacetate-decarboxylating)(NADP+)
MLEESVGVGTQAIVLVMTNVDVANISYNLLRIAAGEGITVGGILLGAARPVHILTPSSTVRRIVNMTALATVDTGVSRAAG